MDSFTKKIHYFIGYGHIHTGNLRAEQKRSLITSLAKRDSFPILYSEFSTEKGFELGELIALWESHEISTTIYRNCVKDLFFDYYADLIDEMFEAELSKNDDDFIGSGIDDVFANRRLYQEVQRHVSR